MKTIQTHLLVIGLCILAISSACQPDKLALIDFQPEKDSLFKLSFSYPASWEWVSSPNSRKTYDSIGVFDPYSIDDGKNKSGMVSVDVWIDPKPKTEMQEQIASHLEGIEALDRLNLRDDRTLEIDGHNARWLTILNTWESNDPGVTYVQEFIYLLAEDRYYTITLYIPENEVGGRFHTEFKAMVESIKVLP